MKAGEMAGAAVGSAVAEAELGFRPAVWEGTGAAAARGWAVEWVGRRAG